MEPLHVRVHYVNYCVNQTRKGLELYLDFFPPVMEGVGVGVGDIHIASFSDDEESDGRDKDHEIDRLQ